MRQAKSGSAVSAYTLHVHSHSDSGSEARNDHHDHHQRALAQALRKFNLHLHIAILCLLVYNEAHMHFIRVGYGLSRLHDIRLFYYNANHSTFRHHFIIKL